jgi:hypothetical protein
VIFRIALIVILGVTCEIMAFVHWRVREVHILSVLKLLLHVHPAAFARMRYGAPGSAVENSVGIHTFSILFLGEKVLTCHESDTARAITKRPEEDKESFCPVNHLRS